jgi:hypothetical protein
MVVCNAVPLAFSPGVRGGRKGPGAGVKKQLQQIRQHINQNRKRGGRLKKGKEEPEGNDEELEMTFAKRLQDDVDNTDSKWCYLFLIWFDLSALVVPQKSCGKGLWFGGSP